MSFSTPVDITYRRDFEKFDGQCYEKHSSEGHMETLELNEGSDNERLWKFFFFWERNFCSARNGGTVAGITILSTSH